MFKKYIYLMVWGPLYYYGLTLIPAWISNHIRYKVRVEITDQFHNFNGCPVEVRGWINNSILHLTGRVIHYNDVIMSLIASQITSLTIVYSTVCLFRRRSTKTSKLRVTGLCARNSTGTGEIPTQRASNAENVSIWWRHHVTDSYRE